MAVFDSNGSAFDITKENPHVMIDQAYGYTGRFRDGSCLISHPIERQRFDERRLFSVYVNNFKSMIDSMVVPVFDEKIVRETDDEMAESFLDNVDNMGTDMTSFMSDAATELRKHSTVFVIVDNFPAEAILPTDAENIENRVYPYCYIKKPQELYAYTQDKYRRIESITFLNGDYEEGTVKYQKLIEFTKSDISEYYIKSDKLIQIDSRPNPIGIVPVVRSADTRPESGKLCADPARYPLMRMAHACFNKDSEMREVERKQEFSLAVFFGDVSPQIGTGTGNAIALPADAKPPLYLEPNPDILRALLDTRNQLRDDMYLVAGQNGIVAIERGSESGVSKAYDFKAQASVLAQTATLCEKMEKDILAIFFKWIGREYDYEVEYDKNYNIIDEAQQMKWIDQAIVSDAPSTIKKMAMITMAKKINPDISQEELEEIEKEIDAENLSESLDDQESNDDSEDDAEDEQPVR